MEENTGFWEERRVSALLLATVDCVLTITPGRIITAITVVAAGIGGLACCPASTLLHELRLPLVSQFLAVVLILAEIVWVVWIIVLVGDECVIYRLHPSSLLGQNGLITTSPTFFFFFRCCSFFFAAFFFSAASVMAGARTIATPSSPMTT